MSRTASDLKKLVPMSLAFVVGVIGAFRFFISYGPTDSLGQNMVTFDTVLGTMAMAIGIINLSLLHGRFIARRRRGWVFSVILVAFMYFALLIGLGATGTFTRSSGIKTSFYGVIPMGTESIAFFLQEAILNPASTTVMSLLAFYIASAAYRTFRIRNIDSAILLVSGTLVLLGQAPIGSYFFGTGILDLKTWILSVPNMAGSRGTNIGIAIGSIAMAIRVLFAYERRPTLGGVE